MAHEVQISQPDTSLGRLVRSAERRQGYLEGIVSNLVVKLSELAEGTGRRGKQGHRRDGAQSSRLAASIGITTVKRLESYIKNVKEVRRWEPSDA